MPTKKTRQTDIGGTGFDGNAPLTVDDAKLLEISRPEDIPDKLLTNWTGGIIGSTTLTLTNDNRRVENANFILLGNIFSNHKSFTAAKYWDLPPDLNLVISELDTSLFKFRGTLASDLVDSSLVDYYFTRDGNRLPEDEESSLNVTGFTLRAYVAPISGERAKLSIVLYPLPVDVLKQLHPLCARPQFPGLLLSSAEFNFAPLASALLYPELGFPFYPALIPSQPFNTLPNLPPAQALKAAIAALLRRVVKPECKQNHNTLLPRWEELKAEGESTLKDLTPELLWPLPKDPAPQHLGRTNITFHLNPSPPTVHALISFYLPFVLF